MFGLDQSLPAPQEAPLPVRVSHVTPRLLAPLSPDDAPFLDGDLPVIQHERRPTPTPAPALSVGGRRRGHGQHRPAARNAPAARTDRRRIHRAHPHAGPGAGPRAGSHRDRASHGGRTRRERRATPDDQRRTGRRPGNDHARTGACGGSPHRARDDAHTRHAPSGPASDGLHHPPSRADHPGPTIAGGAPTRPATPRPA